MVNSKQELKKVYSSSSITLSMSENKSIFLLTKKYIKLRWYFCFLHLLVLLNQMILYQIESGLF
jgi:hypothetical protein